MASAEQLPPETVPRWLAVPSEANSAPVWSRPVAEPGSRPPAVWLLGAHGGAGVSTLEKMWAPAGDSRRGWPAADSAPFVVIVARMQVDGLNAAHQLALQHRAQKVGACGLLGLVTVAAAPGKPAVSVVRRREIVAAAAGANWHIDWTPELLSTPLADLATWQPGYTAPAVKRLSRPLPPTDAVPASAVGAIEDIFAAAREQWRLRKS
jgi:hypothetical protein